ncbi:MAG: hypothetical protein V1907_01490 [Candidatus Kerfeldbacteria bacterium]
MNQSAGNKSNTVILIVIITISVMIIGFGIYWFTRNSIDTKTVDATNTTNATTNANVNTNTVTADGLYVGDDFTIIQPAGWVQGQIPGTLASFQNIKESHATDSAAAKINFKSYIAVSFDNTNGKTLDQVYQTTVDGITSSIPSVKTIAASNEIVNGLQAKFVVMELNQQDVAYTVLAAVYFGDGKYYVVSFNTTTEKWIGYKDKFYEVARSFKLKK